MEFFSADHHFEHENIIEYCDRPFDDVEEMNRHLVVRHNEMVDPEDTVYHLGDVAFGSQPRQWLSQLNGNIVLIGGNHDRNDGQYWGKVVEAYESDAHIMEVGEHTIFLVHDPGQVAPLGPMEKPDDAMVVCGHVHADWKFLPNKLNVGVDCWHFRPVPVGKVIDYCDENRSRREYNNSNRGFHDAMKEAIERREQLGLS